MFFHSAELLHQINLEREVKIRSIPEIPEEKLCVAHCKRVPLF